MIVSTKAGTITSFRCSWSKSLDFSALFCCFSWSFLYRISFKFIFPPDLLFLCQGRSRYQRCNRPLDLHDQDPKISLLLLGLDFRQGPNSLQNASFYKKLKSKRNEKTPNKSTKIHKVKKTKLKTKQRAALNVWIPSSCLLFYQVNFQIATVSLGCKIVKGNKLERKLGEGIEISFAFGRHFFLECYGDVTVFSREIKNGNWKW